MRSAFFCDLTQRRLVILCWCFRTASRSIFCLDYLTPKDGTNRLSQNVGNKLPIYTEQDPRRVQFLLYHLFWHVTIFPPLIWHTFLDQGSKHNKIIFLSTMFLPAIVFLTFTNPTGHFQHSALLWLVFTSLIRTFMINPLSPIISIHFFYKQDHWT